MKAKHSAQVSVCRSSKAILTVVFEPGGAGDGRQIGKTALILHLCYHNDSSTGGQNTQKIYCDTYVSEASYE